MNNKVMNNKVINNNLINNKVIAAGASLAVIGLCALLASSAVLSAEGPALTNRRLTQEIRIQTAPVSAAAEANVSVVQTPLTRTPALRRLELTSASDQRASALVTQKIASVLGPGVKPVILSDVVSLPSGANILHVVIPGEQFTYHADTGEFVGSILVGAVADRAAAPELPDPMTFQLLDASRNTTTTLAVKTLAPPFASITVGIRNPQSPVTLRVASGGSELFTDVVVPLKPTLFVQPVNSSVMGEGAGETEIQIWAIADTLGPEQAVLLQAEPAAEITPSRVVLGPDGTGVAKVKYAYTGEVTITARAPTAGFEPGTAKVNFTPVPTLPATPETSLPTTPQTSLRITPRYTEIEGFGVGVTMLTIEASAPDLPPEQPVTIKVEPAGYLPDTDLVLHNGRLLVPLQSEGRGLVTVTVSMLGLSATTEVTYKLPVTTAAASLGGGLFGGTVRLLARPSGRRKWSTVLASLALSVGVAVIAYLLFRIGVNIFPIKPTLENGTVVVFVLAALAGFIGVSILPNGSTQTADAA
ncbi:MAG: hypothetical protein LBF16_08670 [Pseudomonadales bacterium]|jgi:hypothetical protein|nr:hypothetical protein [Pseudomonadales bacterium]